MGYTDTSGTVKGNLLFVFVMVVEISASQVSAVYDPDRQHHLFHGSRITTIQRNAAYSFLRALGPFGDLQ